MSNHTLEDGSQAVVTASGEVISGHGGVAMWQEPDEDGNLVTYYEDEPSRAHAQDRHRTAVSKFRKSNQYRRAVRRLAPRVQAPRRSASSCGRPKARRTSASSRTSSADPGDSSSDEPPPAPVVPTLAPPPRAIYSYGFAPEGSR